MHEKQSRHRHGQGMAQAKRQACSLYNHPSSDEVVNAYDDYQITWDCACLGSSVADIDITLYYYGGGALHAWTGVPCAPNAYTTQFKPQWWNSTTSAQLQLQITESGQPVWATTTGLGPSFDIAWNGTTPASMGGSTNGTSTGVSIESVTNKESRGGLSGGKLGAAVTIPLLALALAVAGYIFYSRRKVKTDRKRWSAYVDHRFSQISGDTGAHTPGGASGRPSIGSRANSGHAGSPDKARGTSGVFMMQQANDGSRPSLASRPVSNYSIGATSNFAGFGAGSNAAVGVRLPGNAVMPSNPFEDYEGGGAHARNYSVAASSALGSHGEKRPASSFFALDGHSLAETPTSAGFEGAAQGKRGHGAGNASISSGTSRPTSHFARTPGTGVGDRVSRVSFAESSFTGTGRAGNNSDVAAPRRSSYFANGPGTASSPNAHRYKASSQGNSISSTSAFHSHSNSNAPAMPRFPFPTAFTADRDVTKGVDANAARSLSAEDLASIAGPASPPTSPPLLGVNADTQPKKKHNITISTSMPRLANPEGRQSILSPDDMLRAYASKSNIAGTNPSLSSMSVPTMGSLQRPNTVLSEQSKYDDENEDFVSVHAHGEPGYDRNGEEVLASSQQEGGNKKGIFNTKFKFGSAK